MPPEQDAEFNAEQVNVALAGTVFANGLHRFLTIDSTNTHALEQARQGAPHGSFYLADEQTAGRGRSDHQWHSAAAEGLYLSVLVRISAEQIVWLPLMAALAAHIAIREVTSIEADLRWPNDILIGDKKVAGILVETTGQAAVIGIGINLHQQSFPEGLATTATSLDLESGRSVSREVLLIAFLKALESELKSVVPERIVRHVSRLSSWVEGKRVDVHGPHICTGITAGVDERGFLRVQTETGPVTVMTGGIRAAIEA